MGGDGKTAGWPQPKGVRGLPRSCNPIGVAPGTAPKKQFKIEKNSIFLNGSINISIDSSQQAESNDVIILYG